MQCEDNSKLRIPLSEVCQTTDIGCVPITNGKPGCNPQPDELPIAFDPSTNTLWLFSCDTREWIAMTKFQMCQLSALNLDNIRNICDILNIGVYFDAGSGCQQGTVTLGELAEKILECLKLETKIITIGQGDGNKVKISIDGLPLDPVYVTGNNIWSEGGSGTESDPLVVATYDPICKWPIKNQNEVDAVSTKHLGACLDGEMARVPYPPKPCEYPQKTQEEVDAAASKNLIACVDGEAVKVPYPKYQPPVCEADQLTLEQAKAKGSGLTIVGCDNGNTVRIPVSQSGFFDRDYICVPTVTASPQGAPIEGTGPLRVGCNGELYVWLCEENRWEEVRFNMNSLSTLTPSAVSDLCNNFRMMGWYSNTGGDPCVQQVKLTLKQLGQILRECNVTDSIRVLASDAYYKHCVILHNVNSGTVYRGRDKSIIMNGGEVVEVLVYGTPFYMTINARNDFSSGIDGLLSVNVRGMLNSIQNHPVSINMVVSDKLDITFAHVNYETSEGIMTTPIYDNYAMRNGLDEEGREYKPYRKGVGGVLTSLNKIIRNGESKTFYVQYFLIFHSSYDNNVVLDIRCSVDAVLYPIKEV